MGRLKLFFASDIHGSDRLFLKLLHVPSVYKVPLLIVGGDITGKAILPVFREGGSYRANVQGTWREARSEAELQELMKEIRFLSYYPYVTGRDEWQELLRDAARLEALFTKLIQEGLERWCAWAEERLRPLGVRLIMNKGNDDPPIAEEVLRRSGFVEFPNERVVELGEGHEMISLGYANLTPWRLPGDLSEEELAARLETLCASVKNMKSCLFNIHVPPHDTHLDLAPQLDEQLRPRLGPGGEPLMAHVGSRAVRQAIERWQPLVGLHGHIHESKGYSRIGRTHCFNPGSEYERGVLKGLYLSLSEDKLDGFLFTTG